MNEHDNEYKLYIPTNVKTRLEFFKGYGIKELISTVIVLVALLPISFILQSKNKAHAVIILQQL